MLPLLFGVSSVFGSGPLLGAELPLMLSVSVFGASGRSCAFVSHLRQPCLVMYFDVDKNVVDRKVLVPGILEKAGGANVNDVAAG